MDTGSAQPCPGRQVLEPRCRQGPRAARIRVTQVLCKGFRVPVPGPSAHVPGLQVKGPGCTDRGRGRRVPGWRILDPGGGGPGSLVLDHLGL